VNNNHTTRSIAHVVADVELPDCIHTTHIHA